jgi:peptidoglycan hydrolase-like protein with peptidoglycan-binding domain
MRYLLLFGMVLAAVAIAAVPASARESNGDPEVYGIGPSSPTGYPSAGLPPGGIRLAQHILKQDGFDPGPEDGWAGPQTHAAIKQFQRSRSLAPTGVLDPDTLRALGLTEVGPGEVMPASKAQSLGVGPTSPTQSGPSANHPPVTTFMGKHQIDSIKEPMTANQAPGQDRTGR